MTAALPCTLTPYAHLDGVCHRCGTPRAGGRRRWCSDACGQAHHNDHIWSVARWTAIKRDLWTCQHCGERTIAPEVNHITPRVGKGYSSGCWNHPDGLETLCHPCHVKVTNAQAAERRANGQEALP